jgi:hypothetical protein
MRVHPKVGGHATVQLNQEPLELDDAVAGGQLRDDLARGDIQGGIQVGRPVAGVVVGGPLGVPGSSGRIGAVRSNACTLVFSSTHSTPGRPRAG